MTTLRDQILTGVYAIKLADSMTPAEVDEACQTIISIDDEPLQVVELVRCPRPGILEIVVGCSPDGTPMPQVGDEPPFPDARLLNDRHVELVITRFPLSAQAQSWSWYGPLRVYFEPSAVPDVFGRQVIRLDCES